MAQPPVQGIVKPNWIGYYVNYEQKWTEWKGIKQGVFSVFEKLEKLAKLRARLDETLDREGLSTALWKELESLIQQLLEISNAIQQIVKSILQHAMTGQAPQENPSSSVSEHAGIAAGVNCNSEEMAREIGELRGLRQAMLKLNFRDDGPVPRCTNGEVDHRKIIAEVHSIDDFVKILTAELDNLFEKTDKLQLRAISLIKVDPPEHLQRQIQEGQDPDQVILEHHEQYLLPVQERVPAEIQMASANPGNRLVMVPREELLAEEEE